MGLATRFPGGYFRRSQRWEELTSTIRAVIIGRQPNDSFGASALSYIPESVWNDTSTVIAASSGGVSTFFFKPPWQTGPGVPPTGIVTRRTLRSPLRTILRIRSSPTEARRTGAQRPEQHRCLPEWWSC